MESPRPKRQKVSRRETAKAIWMITYAACSVDITHQHLHEEKVLCDECYTIQWRESKYTLIHLKQKNKTRMSAMNKAMKQMDEKYGIKGSCITGYDTLMCNEQDEFEMEDHPAFKRMLDHINKDIQFAYWLEQGGSIKEYRKGIFWKHTTATDPKIKTHGQLVRQIKEWTPIIQESDSIRSENALLRSTLIEKENELKEIQTVMSICDKQNEELTMQLIKKTKECAIYQQRLIQNHIDHTLPSHSP